MLKFMISEVPASESKKVDYDTNQEDKLRKYHIGSQFEIYTIR